MRGKVVWVFVICLVMGSMQPPALGKKKKKDTAARLKTLQMIYVDGSPLAVAYIRRNLSQDTCLNISPVASDADAILYVKEEVPGPCQNGTAGICAGIVAQLLDPKTDEALWLTADYNIPQPDLFHGMNGPYQWVLWNLNRACCKGRLLTTPPKDSKH